MKNNLTDDEFEDNPDFDIWFTQWFAEQLLAADAELVERLKTYQGVIMTCARAGWDAGFWNGVNSLSDIQKRLTEVITNES